METWCCNLLYLMREIFHRERMRKDVLGPLLYVLFKGKLTCVESFEYFGDGGGFDGGGNWRGASAAVKGESGRFHCYAIIANTECGVDCGSAGTLGKEIVYIRAWYGTTK